MASEPVPLSGLARRLVDESILDADSAIKSTEAARKEGTPFVSYLVRNGLAEARAIAISAAEEFGVPLMDLTSFDLDAIPKDLVKDNLIRSTTLCRWCVEACGCSSPCRIRPTCRPWTKSSFIPE